MKGSGDIVYALEPTLDPAEFTDVLHRSGLAERRPVDRPEVMAAMTLGADVIVTARRKDQLVGVSRALSDFAYCTYLSDLAVDRGFQRQGIGRRLIEETHRVAGTKTTLILLAAPAAVDYYPHIGMERHESCWVIRPR
ncbi:MAG TPA: GNAT family N-acetyltransferase [Acidimicrobiia bacterium]|jgi:GNAT superfamily N-acetyltransferase|nr:GNAT family N-acetyltransferase [Acidimicrobiia bacterium]